jgi:hypothetical protein
LHQRTHQAVVPVQGFDHYLADFGSLESKKKCSRLIDAWPISLTVSSVGFAGPPSCLRNQQPSNEVSKLRTADWIDHCLPITSVKKRYRRLS